MNNNIILEIIDNITYLPYNLQKQVLNYTIKLKKNYTTGISGKRLLRFAGSISADDIKIMSDVIEKDFGQVDLNEW